MHLIEFITAPGISVATVREKREIHNNTRAGIYISFRNHALDERPTNLTKLCTRQKSTSFTWTDARSVP